MSTYAGATSNSGMRTTMTRPGRAFARLLVALGFAAALVVTSGYVDGGDVYAAPIDDAMADIEELINLGQ